MGDWNTCLRLFAEQGVVWLGTSSKHLALVGKWDRHCWGVGMSEQQTGTKSLLASQA